ncbi:alpha-lytic protease prodomain-containing protein [Amycolatopsis roodepoortensis]|uniref:alpha-lytic protease prodomain-containing protein n=1 Tax=Amycolatopsis roodepoortensis TaxID=700274 RepID=UPI000F8878FA|nr:alpha-lytic protease prodomain-containing protein [Amycolatopsis roodepoortensis]RSN22168.1 serine protease [Streptomyces sp. WAC 05977]UUV32819.1 alpha-lytic protease prodomain-containing protein [Amycolatopsis roodepoortensis]
MNRKILAATAAAITGAGLVTAIALTPNASAGQQATAGDQVQSEMLAAMARDLKLTPEQAKLRMASEQRAAVADNTLKKQLGTSYAGSWLDGSGTTLTVAVTDAAVGDLVRAAGAIPKTVARSAADLDAAKLRLDAKSAKAPKTVPGWFTDVTTNSIVVLANAGGEGAAKSWAAESGVPSDLVRVEASTEQPRALIDIIGGNAYTFGSGRCSIGFAVDGGFVTAGHCGRTGTRTSNPSGSVAGSSFPGNDYAWVRADAGNTPRPLVNRYPGTVPVAGSTEAPVNSSVCRSGSTTGWRCGTILQKNTSVTYPEGTITGLTRTNACAEPGDSGGSWLTGDQAQGVTSGGSGNCTSGGTIYFQPVSEILSVYNLRLTVSGNPPSSTTTTPTTPTTPTSPTTSNPPGGTWAPYTYYGSGATASYGGSNYRVIQPHTSMPGWEPPNVPALWELA